jgi:hypothetical protein
MPIPPIPPPPVVVIEQAFQQQIQTLQERLRQSEINLAAQRDSMQINKKVLIFYFRQNLVIYFNDLD